LTEEAAKAEEKAAPQPLAYITNSLRTKYREEVKADGQSEEQKSYFSRGLEAVVGTAALIGAKTKEKFEEAKIGEKMKKAGSAIAEGTKTAGAFIVEKSKAAASVVAEKGREIKANPKFQSAYESTTDSLTKAKNAISNAFSNMFVSAKKEEEIPVIGPQAEIPKSEPKKE
jgi:hypothetical protein